MSSSVTAASTLEHRRHQRTLQQLCDGGLGTKSTVLTPLTHSSAPSTSSLPRHPYQECPYAMFGNNVEHSPQRISSCNKCFVGNSSGNRLEYSCPSVGTAAYIRRESVHGSTSTPSLRARYDATERTLLAGNNMATAPHVVVSCPYSDVETTDLLVSEECPDCIAMKSELQHSLL